MQAIGKNVVLKVIEEEKKEGSLILMESAKTPNNYEVLSIGEEVKYFSVGDRVYLNKYSGYELKVKDDVFLVIDFELIMAKQ